MSDLTTQKYDMLDQEGVMLLAKGILDKVNIRIAQRITQSLDANDTKHVPSSAAVLRAINTSRHAKIQTVTGDIDIEVPLEERSTSVLYFQRDNEEDTTWMIYIWNADPEIVPDPNGEWICLGDTEIDLSGYWSKDAADILELKNVLGINDITGVIETLTADVANLKTVTQGHTADIANINTILDQKVNRDELVKITADVINNIMDYVDAETDPFPEEAATISEVTNAITAAAAAGKSAITVELTDDLDLTTGDQKVIDVPAGMKATIKIPEGKEVKCGATAFTVQNGGKLILGGSGTITDTSKAASGAIKVENGGQLTINGVTIDCVTEQGTENNWCYGVYAKKDTVINFMSGTIKVAGASCISTNNLTGAAEINVYGGELLAECGYAIYMPAQGKVNITGGTVQGIHARMGEINISGDAKIIPVEFNDSNAVPIGANIATSGSVELGDTIVVMAGAYASTADTNTNVAINITENATVESNFRSAIGIYAVDTKEGPKIEINIAKAGAVKTNDAAFEAITVFDHEYIADSAAAAGKTYAPVAQSDITVAVAGEKIYPAA